MARRGRFGRVPRSSTDLSATIVAMAREYQNMRERNMLDSWEKGGKFEGKKVTDGMLLDFLQDRRDHLAKDDPTWDQYDQRLDQYKFAIANSKMELRYAEGKVGDGAMASFYRTWAGKLPQNSEAWRNLMTTAAQYRDRAAQRSAGGGRARASAGYNSAQNRTAGKKEAPYDATLQTLTELARREGILNTRKETIGDLRVAEGDASRLVDMLDRFNNGESVGGLTPQQVKTLKGQLTKYIQDASPGFNGEFSFTGFQHMWEQKVAGQTQRYNRASAAGRKGDVKAIAKEMTDSAVIFGQASAAPLLKQYEMARAHFNLITEDPNSDPIDIALAMQDYKGTLQKIYDNVPATDAMSTTKGHLNNELRGLNGEDINAPTLNEDSRGTVAHYREDGGETKKIGPWVRDVDEQVKNLVTGRGVMARVGPDGQPSSKATDKFGVVPVAALQGTDGIAYVPATGQLPSYIRLSNGVMAATGQIQTAVIGTPVYVTGVSDLDPQGHYNSTVESKAYSGVGFQLTMPDGTVVWQYQDDNGVKRYSTANPFVDSMGNPHQQQPTQKGIQITVPVPNAQAKFDPRKQGIGHDFTDPGTVEARSGTVFRSSFSAWLSSGAKDSGMAYVVDPTAARAAVAREMGGANPAQLAAAVAEVDQARIDYVNNVPDSQKRLEAAYRRGLMPTLPDKAGVNDSDPIDIGFDQLVKQYLHKGEGPQDVRTLDPIMSVVGQAIRSANQLDQHKAKMDAEFFGTKTAVGATIPGKPAPPQPLTPQQKAMVQLPFGELIGGAFGAAQGLVQNIQGAFAKPPAWQPPSFTPGMGGLTYHPGSGVVAPNITPKPPPPKPPPPEPKPTAPSFNPNYVQTNKPAPSIPGTVHSAQGDYVMVNGRKQYI